MTKHEIGVNAGTIWQILSDNAKWNFTKLKKASGLNDKELYAALGWLAREDKIDFGLDEKEDVKVSMKINVFIG